MSARPDWASGAEWEGWTYRRLFDEMYRKARRATLRIEPRGRMYVDNEHIPLPSPADALDVANLIAEKLGGWGE